MENNFRLAGDKTNTNNAALFLTTYYYLEVQPQMHSLYVLQTRSTLSSLVVALAASL